MSKTTEDLRIDYDGKWKILIQEEPKFFISFILPEIFPLIDFNSPLN